MIKYSGEAQFLSRLRAKCFIIPQTLLCPDIALRYNVFEEALLSETFNITHQRLFNLRCLMV
jgi:hypothetical protein